MSESVVDQHVFEQLLERQFFCKGNCARNLPVYADALFLIDGEPTLGIYCGHCCERYGLNKNSLTSLKTILTEMKRYGGARDSDALPLTVRTIALAEEGIFHPRPPAQDDKNKVKIRFFEHEEFGLVHTAVWNNETIIQGQGKDITGTIRTIMKSDPTAFIEIESDADPHVF